MLQRNLLDRPHLIYSKETRPSGIVLVWTRWHAQRILAGPHPSSRGKQRELVERETVAEKEETMPVAEYFTKNLSETLAGLRETCICFKRTENISVATFSFGFGQ